jgi:hypothetical protein
MNWYKLLFYKFYKVAIFLGNEDFYPEINAWFLATLLPWFNFLSFLLVLKYYSVITYSVFKIIIIASSLFWIWSYIFCTKNRRYLLILEEMEAKDLKRKKMTTLLLIFYSLFTVFVYVYLAE